ncbi:MAG: hypothetical protein IT423_13910 [Pirellulaceae bacterium]|nr:hypothetical protein [Pirellulaceae bacterium]
MTLLLSWAHCRNRWLGSILLGSLGGLCYISSFYFSMVSLSPAELWYRLDALPQYVELRIETDVQRSTRAQRLANQEPEPRPLVNLLFTAAEWLACIVVPAFAGATRSTRAYNSQTRRWTCEEKQLLPNNTSPKLIAALEDAAGNGQALFDLVATPLPLGERPQPTTLTLEYTTDDCSPLKHPIYLTISDWSAEKRITGTDMKQKIVARQVLLSGVEAITMRSWFPNFEQSIELYHPQLREVAEYALRGSGPSSTAGQAKPTSRSPPQTQFVTSPGRALATIQPAPAQYRNRVRSTSYRKMLGLLSNAGGLARMAAFACVFVATTLLKFSALWAIVPGVLTLVLAAISLFIHVFGPSGITDVWVGRRVRKTLAQRTDALVPADDPDSLFVSIMPNFPGDELVAASLPDLALMKFDRQHQAILFEGDRDRYHIPFASVVECQPRQFSLPGSERRHIQFWMVQLTIHTAQGPQAFLIGIGEDRIVPPATNTQRYNEVFTLCELITAEMMPVFVQPPAKPVIPALTMFNWQGNTTTQA